MDAPADLRAPRGRYGPFCSYPHVPRPAGEYGTLWYGNDESAKHFLSHTRVYNCAYAFSSLHATRIKRKGKPVFQLRGAVYYRIAPAMVPPNGYGSSPAPTLCTSGRNLRPPNTSNHPAACLPLPG